MIAIRPLREGSAANPEIRLMVVDDQTLFRESLSRMLAGLPGMIVVSEASDGLEAVREARVRRPNLVLMDLGLPQIDGFEATRRLKQEFPSIRVIAITAYPSDDLFRRAIAAGVDSVLLKDARLDDVVAAIRQTHAGNRLFNGSVLRGLTEPRSGRRPNGLTPRELETLKALASGLPNRAIAAKLSISEKTVRNHVANIYAKLSISGRAQAVLFAIEKGIVGTVRR